MPQNRWDETWHRLRDWTSGQGPSERLAAQILAAEGYKAIDPSHPLGGPDGGKDAVCQHEGRRFVMAVHFARGEERFSELRSKFAGDVSNARSRDVQGIAFVTNQELRLAEREVLCAAIGFRFDEGDHRPPRVRSMSPSSSKDE